MTSDNVNVHHTAEVSQKAQIGSGTRVWHLVQIREGVVVGKNCIIGKLNHRGGGNQKTRHNAILGMFLNE